MKVYVHLAVLIVIGFSGRVQSDSLSLSIAGMSHLIVEEKILIDNLERYLQALESKAEVIRSNLKLMKDENEKALREGDAYLMNPLQAFSLLRRLHSDWVHWEVYMRKSVGDEYSNKIKSERANLPTDEEFSEAVDAMYRLQDTYALNPITMSMGNINGIQYSSKLSAIDCYSIGYQLNVKGFYDEATFWFHAAMNLFKEDDPSNEVLGFDMKDILYFYAHADAAQNHLERAVLLIQHLLSRDPTNANAILQKKIWETEIKAREDFPKEPEKRAKQPSRYQLGCRGQFQERNPNLYCIYNTTTYPFLKLAPFKMEVINLDPFMVLYHDVISDYEINVLQTLAKPKLQRATVYSVTKKGSVPVSTRTSKFAWFPDNTNEVTARINRRLAHLTGFDLRSSEQIQVMNYGIGGHYSAHYDFFNVSSDSEVVREMGDRVATALFYLTDVEQGGATVFPNLNLAVFPKKGACILWYNINDKGVGDQRTLHAACPVIVGSKWICNKWIREREQLFRRPCLRE